MGEFEDQFEDEVEDEDEGEVVIAPDSDEEEDEDEMELDNNDDEAEPADDLEVYLPGQKLAEDEELVADPSTYEMLHSMGVEWPCLSFDVLRDRLGTGRATFPMTSYIVAGSQAEQAKDNKLYVMKMSQLHKTKVADDEDGEESGDDDLDDDPILEYKTVPHYGGVNRVRVMPHNEAHIVASWADTGKVHIYDITEHVRALDTPGLIPPREPKPMYTIDNHGAYEGYAMDWSSLQTGHLVTGDTKGRIFLTQRTESAQFVTNKDYFRGHTDSVEDLQWCPTRTNVFASASVDQTIKIWDARERSKPQLSVHAHDSDVNVISWHTTKDNLLASGSDSGVFSIWDLRTWSVTATPTPAATYKWHQDAITSIEWAPHESSALAVAGADDQITLWDLSMEKDEDEAPTIGASGVEVPPQLMFIHQGQQHIKELHYHRQCPGVIISTALNGFNVFKTINS
ncbi:WD40-repeat-containing domain protein [Fimicolochytrium jonesii]|uniref:WD40-repeat-containing domain protein n=1 Tax=Fimicolochytrium jonesii TaxID=1396493 RepID=UPI0022FF1107|nr:WD40-repeat-containing domain protein [Fimicolochytrium jonesii]KAI8821671.1 WD40-repeat-containing domain protein [Fimicolochytrium jonesii]